MYKVPDGENLKDAPAIGYGNSLSRKPYKLERQLIDLHSDNEDPSDAVAKKPVSASAGSSEGGSKESSISDWEFGSRDVKIVVDY